TLGAFKAAGNLSSDLIEAPHGIGTFSVGRGVLISEIVADDSQVGAPAVGRICTLTAGSFQSTTLTAGTLGSARITGFSSPEINNGSSFTPGDIANSTIAVKTGTPTSPIGIGSFSVSGGILSSMLTAPFGIATLTVGASLSG